MWGGGGELRKVERDGPRGKGILYGVNATNEMSYVITGGAMKPYKLEAL